MPARIDESEDDDADDAAVTGHPAFPDPKNRERIAQHLGFVKKDVAKPATDKDASNVQYNAY